jgi:serine/threonine-protein kinase HipA
MKNLDIYTNSDKAGVLALESNKYVFTYDSHAPSIVSVTMPIRTQSWTSSKLHPIFEMNLPEGALKEAIKDRFAKLTNMDDLGMLRLIGSYVIGRVKYGKPDTNNESIQLIDILNNDTHELFESLMQKFAVRSGVSGVQPKMLLDIQDKNTLTTEHYIVKSWGNEYPELALNEFFCMEAIRFSGLSVPAYYLSKNRSMFVMKRFDLKDDGSFYGFEDGCVLLGKSTEEKYSASYEDLAKAIKSSVKPEKRKQSLIDLFTAIIMNHLLRNGDGHLKNYGILYENDYTDAVMAPIYDVVCTTVYIKEDIPALKMSDGKLWFKEKTYRNFAKNTCQMKISEIDETIQKCKSAVQKTLIALDIYVQKNKEIEIFANRLKEEWEKGLASLN